MITASRHRLRFALFLLLLGMLLLGLSGIARAATPRVVELVATGTVDGAMAAYLEEGIAAAAEEGATAVVVRLDTPGGSLAAMDEIKQAFLAAPLPVIVWVAPSGARAASAGTFITLAAHLVLHGARDQHRRGVAGLRHRGGHHGDDGRQGPRGRDRLHRRPRRGPGRPVDWAVSTVEEARSYTASEAVAAGAVDGIAATMDEVLAQADGREVEVSGAGMVTLELTGAEVVEAPMNPLLGLVHLLSDPNLAFLLFVLGVLGLATELIHPNLVTGILGAFALLLSFVGFGSLPLNFAGVLLLIFGFVLFVLETQIVSHGLLTVGGLVCVALGASMLYTAPLTPGQPAVQVGTARPCRHGRDARGPDGRHHGRRDPHPSHEGPDRPARRARSPRHHGGRAGDRWPRSERSISRARRGPPARPTSASCRATSRCASLASTVSPPSWSP